MAKYNFSISVPWASVSELFRWRLRVLIRDARHYISCSELDLVHHLGNRYFVFHEYQAACACQEVFDFLSVYSSLRAFLRYSPLDEEALGVSVLRVWFSVHSDDAFSHGVVSLPSGAPYFHPEEVL